MRYIDPSAAVVVLQLQPLPLLERWPFCMTATSADSIPISDLLYQEIEGFAD